MSFFKKLFGLGGSEEGIEEKKNAVYAADTDEVPEEVYEEEEEEEMEDSAEEEEYTEEELKMIERDRRIQEAMSEPTYHVFDEHDKSPQGQKAIQMGIENRRNGRSGYDYTKAPGADFNWPDYPKEKIGHMEPWLCYGVGEDSGWIDLNEYGNGTERRAVAAYRTLGFPEGDNPKFMYVEQKAITELGKLLEMDDQTLNVEAPKEGMKSNDRYSYRDFVLGMKLDYEKSLKKSNAKVQQVMDVANEMMQEEMNANIAAAKAGGLLDPIQGIAMEDWAAANAKIANGVAYEEVLKILGVEKPVWDEVSAEWNARMSQDTTFAITKVYGDAFVNSDIGKFAGMGGVKASGATEAVEKVKGDFERYVKIMCHQNVATASGTDASSVLQQYGLSAADWGMVGMHWSQMINSDITYAMKMTELMDRFNAEFAATAAPKAADDIDF